MHKANKSNKKKIKKKESFERPKERERTRNLKERETAE